MTLVLLDLDGTLCDSLPGIAAGINATLGTAYGLEEVRPWVGPPLQETFAALLGRPREEVEPVVAEYRERYRARMAELTPLYPGVVELLDALRDGGRTLAVATSKARHLAVELLEAKGIADRFAAIEGPVPPATDDKAQTIAAALRATGTASGAAGVWHVGDRRHDVEGAHAHGLRCCGALWGFGTAAELREAGADALARDPAEAAALLLA